MQIDADNAPKPTVAILTLGCKLNQADSEAMARQLAAAGCQVVDEPTNADAFIINSCSVTHVADRKARHMVRLARRRSPETTVVLTGCYVETGGHDLADKLGADLVVGNRGKARLPQRLLALWLGGPHSGYPAPLADQPSGALRTRAFLKVQEGCNDVCAFCIVPRTRGREVSVPIPKIIEAVRQREAEGVQEVVLTGTQIGAYGRDMGLDDGPRRLLAAVLSETNVPRIRLSSLQPQHIARPLLDLWQNPRLCRHFHMALQSGSDAVLKRMRRRYNMRQFSDAVDLMRRQVPDVAITTDIIVGFPGETEEDFQQTLAVCREIDFAQIHVFPFSPRRGTTAALMQDMVPQSMKQQRTERMLALARDGATAFRRRYQGREMAVLWEEGRQDGEGNATLWRGLTDNYLRVYAHSPRDLHNRLLSVRLGALRDDGLWGELDGTGALAPVGGIA